MKIFVLFAGLCAIGPALAAEAAREHEADKPPTARAAQPPTSSAAKHGELPAQVRPDRRWDGVDPAVLKRHRERSARPKSLPANVVERP